MTQNVSQRYDREPLRRVRRLDLVRRVQLLVDLRRDLVAGARSDPEPGRTGLFTDSTRRCGVASRGTAPLRRASKWPPPTEWGAGRLGSVAVSGWRFGMPWYVQLLADEAAVSPVMMLVR